MKEAQLQIGNDTAGEMRPALFAGEDSGDTLITCKAFGLVESRKPSAVIAKRLAAQSVEALSLR